MTPVHSMLCYFQVEHGEGGEHETLHESVCYLQCGVIQHQAGRARETNGAVKSGHVVVAHAVDEFDLTEFQKHCTAKPCRVVVHRTSQKGGDVLVLTDQHRPTGEKRERREKRERERETGRRERERERDRKKRERERDLLSPHIYIYILHTPAL